MEHNLEKRLLQKDINNTPKVILEHLFYLSEEKRIRYEESEFKYKKKEYKIKNEILPLLFNDLKNETELRYIKSIKKNIKHQLNMIKKYRKELKLIRLNENILWINVLKMDKILDYGLE